ncbi:MAG: 50S ribosomal protein L22 [Patescibacteria group bacterium]|nr:50S ribosomal protein L22 [Patescibacteria group bacterium]
MIKQVQKSKIKNQNHEGKVVTVRARYLRISAQKLNLLAKILRRQSLTQAMRMTRFSSVKAARLIGKLLKSGETAAREKGLEVENLYVTSLLVGQGPSLKRGRPVARGSYHPIRKKTAHLVLELKEVKNGS